MSRPETPDDAAFAAELAEAAGRILLALRDKGDLTGAALGQAGDIAANSYLVETLLARRPLDGLLSEERVCDGARLAKSRVWIIDPLDGTREYGEGRADWAVHVALAVDGVAHIGAVALPARGLVLRSDRPSALPPAGDPLRMLVSRSRPAPQAVAVAGTLGAILVPMGSAGAKAMAVVLGDADIYLHSGGQYEWDNCAPVAVAQAYGLHCSRIDGSPLRYNIENPYLPDLLICRPALAAPVNAALGAL